MLKAIFLEGGGQFEKAAGHLQRVCICNIGDPDHHLEIMYHFLNESKSYIFVTFDIEGCSLPLRPALLGCFAKDCSKYTN